MKKAISLALAFVLALGLTGCGSSSNSSTGTAAETTANTEQSAPEAAQLAEPGEAVYTVMVMDDNGSPVRGATIQFCSDTECMTGQTSADGTAVFEQPAGSYTVHVLKTPAGYISDGTEYEAPATPGSMTIVLEAEGATETDGADTIDYSVIGVTYRMPQAYLDAAGTLDMNGGYLDSGSAFAMLMYYAIAPERMDEFGAYFESYADAYLEGKDPPEAPDPAWMSSWISAYPFEVYAINGGRGEDDLRKLMVENYYLEEGETVELEHLETIGDTNFYLAARAMAAENQAEYQNAMGSYYDEFAKICADKETFLSGLTLTEPKWQKSLGIGDKISFESTDLDGNPVTSAELFGQSKVTMINVWATWCSPCKRELPELAKLAEDFSAQGGQIIGLCLDADKDETISEAKSILSEAGVSYVNVAPYENMLDELGVLAYPTTFFVDQDGKLLAEPITGAYVELYPTTMTEALAKVS